MFKYLQICTFKDSKIACIAYFPYICDHMKKLLLTILALLTVFTLSADDEIMAFHLSKLRGGMPDNNVREIYQDSIGFMYFRYNHIGCYRYDGYNFQHVPDSLWLPLKQNALEWNRHTQGHADGGHVRLDDCKVIYTNKRTGQHFSFSIIDPTIQKKSDNLKFHTLIDGQGCVWASVNGNGLFYYNPKTGRLRHITYNSPDNIISTNYIVYMIADRDGNVWVAQENAGLAKLRSIEPQYTVYTPAPTTQERTNSVRMIYPMADGTILLSTGNGYLFRADPQLTSFKLIQHFTSSIYCALTDSKGRLWLGSRMNGINIDGRWYGHGRIDHIVEDRKGRVWYCGINGHLIQGTLTSDGRFSEQHFLTGIKGLRPHTLLLDRHGRIVVGAEKGVLRFNPDELLRDTSSYEWLANVSVVPLLEDSKGRLWAGTKKHGVLMIGGDTLTVANGLPSNIVQSLCEDSFGRICVGTTDGCTYYDPKTRHMNQLYFYKSPQHNFFNEKAAIRLADGRMAFGTTHGLIAVDKDFHNVNTTKRKPYITSLDINGASYYETDGLYSKYGRLEYAGHIELTHDQNTLTLSFSNFDYNYFEPALFSYRLVGYDSEWSHGSHANSTTYKNLRPGRYTFLLKYQNKSGQWTEEYKMITIDILPPWYLTWWAMTIFSLVFAALLWWIYRQLRTEYQLRRDIVVEKQLTEFKINFFTNISHEFRTPLTLIQGAMERINSVRIQTAELRMPIDRMQRNVDRMLRLVNELLEFRRMQEGKLHLALEQTEVVSFLRNIIYSFHDVAENRHITTTFTPQKKTINTYIDRGFVDKMVYELLNNSFKYTPKGGNVTMKVKSQETGTCFDHETDKPQNLVIEVADTGIGVPPEKQSTLFDRYVRGQQRRNSLGIGLNLVAGLVEAHHGTIGYKDREGGGAVFTITLPMNKNIYAESDFLTGDLADQEKSIAFSTHVSEINNPMNDRHVMIVEDDDEVLSYLNQELGRYFIVTTATDGEDALEKLKQEHSSIQLVITDIMMPKMNGIDLCRRLRKDENTRSIPVIMLTALSADDKQMTGYNAGADAYITKPFSLELLLAQCRNLIERRDRYKDDFSQEIRRAKNITPQLVTDIQDKRLLQQLTVYIESHLADPNLSAEQFADDMKLGRTTFFTKVKQLTGQTPNEFIREKRLKRACELLSNGSVTISEVTYQVGMKSPSYFSECFKKRYGMSPKQFIKSGFPENNKEES